MPVLSSNPISIDSDDGDRIKFLIYTRLTDPNQPVATPRQIYEFLEDELDVKPGGLYRDRILRRSIRTWIEQITDFITAHSRIFRRPRPSRPRPAKPKSPCFEEYRRLRNLCLLNKIMVDRMYLSELSLTDKVAVLRDTLSEAGVESSDTDQTSCVSSNPSPITEMDMIETIGDASGTRKRKQALEGDSLQIKESKTRRSSISSCASEKSFDDFDTFRPKQ